LCEGVTDGINQFGVVEHTDFDGVDSEVVDDGAYLAGDELCGHGVYAVDALRVFIDKGDDG
jgi:hypothetical protein